MPEAERMLAAVKKAGVTHMICHNYRRAPGGHAGEAAHRGRPARRDPPLSRHLPAGLDRRPEDSRWSGGSTRSKAGSGALGDIAAHSIDLARFLVGEITEVAGDLKTFVKTRPLPDNPKKTGRVTVDDASTSLVRFKNGAIGTIEATRMALGPQELQPVRDQRQPRQPGVRPGAHERARALPGVRQAARARLPPHHGHRARASRIFKAWWPAGHIIGYEHTFIHTVYDLLEAMADGKVPTPNFEDGVRNQRVLGAIEKAAANRRWVTV